MFRFSRSACTKAIIEFVLFPKTKYNPSTDILRIHGKSVKYIYVEEIRMF